MVAQVVKGRRRARAFDSIRQQVSAARAGPAGLHHSIGGGGRSGPGDKGPLRCHRRNDSSSKARRRRRNPRPGQTNNSHLRVSSKGALILILIDDSGVH